MRMTGWFTAGPSKKRKPSRPIFNARFCARSVETQFHLPADRIEFQSDFHYQSNETPNVLGSCQP
jgi:hypothetical protein